MKGYKRIFPVLLALLFIPVAGMNNPAAGWDKPPNRYFFIKSVQSGDKNLGYWDQPGRHKKYKRGSNLMVWAKDGDIDQQFRFHPAGGGWYYIFSKNRGTVDISKGKNANGVNVLIWSYKRKGNKNQKFRFKHVGDGRWKIYTAWGRVLCTPRKYSNGSNIHTWSDHKGPWMEWYFIDANTGRKYMPKVAGISGQLKGLNYSATGSKRRVSPGVSEIEVWARSGRKYVQKAARKTGQSGRFNLGTAFDNEYSILLMSKTPGRSTAYTVLRPKYNHKLLDGFVSEHYDSPDYVLVDTKYRGTQYYHYSNGYFYRVDGKVTRKHSFFFPEIQRINRGNHAVKKLLKAIGAGSRTSSDAEIVKRIRNVFAFLGKNTKSYMGSKDPVAKEASKYMFRNCHESENKPLKRWPTFQEYADTYNRYGFMPVGNCTAWTLATATLLHAAGVSPDKFFVSKFNYDVGWIVEHWVIGVNIGDRWHSLDPQKNRVIKINSVNSFKTASWERYMPKHYDYKMPFEAVVLPGAKIRHVPYMGNPDDLKQRMSR